MGNGIIDRQNEDRSIYYLAAQRQLYNEVKGIGVAIIVLSVFVPFTLSVLQLLFSKHIFWDAMYSTFSVTSMIVAIALGSLFKRKKTNAADIQQHFDVYVYQMPWDHKLFGTEHNITSLVAEKSERILKKTGEREKLEDWYTSVVGSVNLEKGIWMCQKENFSWDVNLRNRYKVFCIVIVSCLIVFISGISVIQDESVTSLMGKVAFVAPMLQWLIVTIQQLGEDIDNLKELDEIINAPGDKNMEQLQEIQSKIYEHRKNCYSIPNIFYQIFKDKDEDIAHRTALMDRD